MNNIKYNILTAIIAIIATPQGYAQLVDKEVEVTREYRPTVESATKLPLTPEMSDDNYITPDIDYTITPISIHSSLETPIYQPIEANFWQYKREKRDYLNLAAGIPYSSEVDIYTNLQSNSSGYIIGFLNQDGRYADIQNNYGQKLNSQQSHLRVGTAAGKYIGERTLEGVFTYNNDSWSRYATRDLFDYYPLYQEVNFDGHYGDNFTNWNRWNYMIDVDGDYFWSRSNYNVSTLGAEGAVGHTALGGELLLTLGYDYIAGDDSYRNNSVNGAVEYSFGSKATRYKFGVEYIHDKVNSIYDSSKKSYFIPIANVNFQLLPEQLYAYIDLGGEIVRNNYASLAQQNPYILAGDFSDVNSVDHSLKFGLKGALGEGAFDYNICGEYGFTENKIYWAYIERTDGFDFVDNAFETDYSNQNRLNFNIDVDYHISPNFTVDFGLIVAKYFNDKDQYLADGEAKTLIDFGGEYNVGRFTFGIGGEMIGTRETTQININSQTGLESSYIVKLPTSFDLNANVDIKLNNGVILYGVIDNICNSQIYRWARYQEYGINGMIGIKLEF